MEKIQSKYSIFFFPGLISFAVYSLTLAPTVTGEDSGEFIAACHSLGISHPPGYPLYTLLGKAFSLLIPVGNIAFRVNLLSAVFASLTVGLLAVCLNARLQNKAIAITCSLIFAFSKVFWSQSVISEVYTLNAFLFLTGLFLIEQWTKEKANNYLIAFIFVFSLAMTNHYITILSLPVFFLYLLGKDKDLFHKKEVYLCAPLVIILALSVYLVLPVRAAKDPGMNWGDPDDFYSFLYHVQRLQYKDLEFSQKVTVGDKLSFSGHYLGQLAEQFLLAVLFSIPGLYVLWRRNLSTLALTLLLFFMNSFFLILLLKFEFNRDNILRVIVYYIPAYLIVILWVADGMKFVYNRIKQTIPTTLLIIGLVLLPLSQVVAFWDDNDFGDYFLTLDYVTNLWKAIEQDSVFFPSGDYQTFPMIYSQVVEEMRCDVVIGDKYGKLENTVADVYFRALGPERQNGLKAEEIQRELILKTTIPIYYTTKKEVFAGQKVAMEPCGLLYRVKRNATWDNQEVWSHLVFRELYKPIANYDYMGKSILASISYFKALRALEENRLRKAMTFFDESLKINADVKEQYNNIAGTLASYGHHERAISLFEGALKIDPFYWQANANLAHLLFSLEKYREAAFFYQRSIEGKTFPVKHYRKVSLREAFGNRELIELNMKAIAAIQAGNSEKGRKLFLEGITQEPRCKELLQNLAFMERNEGNYHLACSLYQKVLPLIERKE